MYAPAGFLNELDREFLSTVRIRWSKARDEWHLEERVGRSALPPTRISEVDDDMIRARDGYALIMRVRPGDRMPCSRCNATLRVPIRETKQIRCSRCGNRDVAAFYELNSTLLEHLRYSHRSRTDPRSIAQRTDRNNANLDSARRRKMINELHASTSDNWNRMTERPTVGYTGKEFH